MSIITIKLFKCKYVFFNSRRAFRFCYRGWSWRLCCSIGIEFKVTSLANCPILAAEDKTYGNLFNKGTRTLDGFPPHVGNMWRWFFSGGDWACVGGGGVTASGLMPDRNVQLLQMLCRFFKSVDFYLQLSVIAGPSVRSACKNKYFVRNRL